MRVKRNKNHRRILRFYRLAFGIQEPYRVIVDVTFLTHALQNKFHVKEQLPKMLEARATPVVTGCVMAELRSLGDRAVGASIIARGFYRVQCGHDKAVGAKQCICEQVGEKNDRNFLVATQDLELTKALRLVPGVPLIRLDGPVPRVEDPSARSRGQHKEADVAKLQVSDWEKKKLPVLVEREAKAKEAAAAPPRKRKGPKGANPLSCRKKKKTGRACCRCRGSRAAEGEARALEKDGQPDQGGVGESRSHIDADNSAKGSRS